MIHFVFILIFSVTTFSYAKKAPWSNGSTIDCYSPLQDKQRVEFRMTVVEAGSQAVQFQLGTSRMKIEGIVLDSERRVHEFSDEIFFGYWPEIEGSILSFFFNEGWPQVTYFIAKFDALSNYTTNSAFAMFYPTKNFQYQNLRCQLKLT